MAKEIISISAEAQTQVGATTFKQRPSSGYMEMWGLSTADNYQTWQRNMPLEDAESYADQVLTSIGNPLENLKMAQATITTLAGGRASVDIRISELEQSKEKEEIEPPDTPEEEEPTPEEEEAWGIGTGNAQVLSCDFVFQEAPLPTLPEIADLADAHPAIRDAIGCVHRGFSIYKPIPIDSAGNMKTPYEILGDEMCALLQSVHTYSVRCMNITYEYKTHRNMTRKCSEQKLGEKIDMTDLPKNKLGGKFGTRGQAYFLGRHIKYDNQEKVYIVEERYLVEIIPTLDEVKKKGHSDDE